MSQRVTLDSPEMGDHKRQTTPNETSTRGRRPQVDSFVVNRAHSARRQQRPTRTTHAKQEVIPHDEVMNKAAAAAQARVRDLEHTKIYSDHYGREQSEPNRWKVNSIYAMASLLFVIGMFVAVNGFVSTTKANQQIDAIDKVLDDGNPTDVRRLAEALPNEDEVTDFDISAYEVAPDEPRYIRIPSIGVDTTRVLNTGLTDGNAVDTPDGIYDTSWYNRSAELTAELGAMFIVGHYDGPSRAGVFFNLEDAKRGNIVEIEHGNGELSHFRITEIVEFRVDAVDMDMALNPVNPDKLGLNLMTCGGEWDVSSQQYDHRTLVRTEKI